MQRLKPSRSQVATSRHSQRNRPTTSASASTGTYISLQHIPSRAVSRSFSNAPQSHDIGRSTVSTRVIGHSKTSSCVSRRSLSSSNNIQCQIDRLPPVLLHKRSFSQTNDKPLTIDSTLPSDQDTTKPVPSQKQPKRPPRTDTSQYTEEQLVNMSVFQREAVLGEPVSRIGDDRHPFVHHSWLRENLGNPNLVIINASWQMLIDTSQLTLYQLFLSSRLDRAQFFDLEEYAVSESLKPMQLPSPEVFADGLGRHGINNQTSVVVYDYNGLLGAARFYWTCLAMGMDPNRIRILEGGWLNWVYHDENPTEGGPIFVPTPTTFNAQLNEDVYIDHADFLGVAYGHYDTLKRGEIDSRLPIIVDTRSSHRFIGHQPEVAHFIDVGHVPGAVNAPYQFLLRHPDDSASGVTLKTQEELTAIFQNLGLDTNDIHQPLVVMSGTGGTAAAGFLALKSIGMTNVRLYDDGWFNYADLAKVDGYNSPKELGPSKMSKVLKNEFSDGSLSSTM